MVLNTIQTTDGTIYLLADGTQILLPSRNFVIQDTLLQMETGEPIELEASAEMLELENGGIRVIISTTLPEGVELEDGLQIKLWTKGLGDYPDAEKLLRIDGNLYPIYYNNEEELTDQHIGNILYLVYRTNIIVKMHNVTGFWLGNPSLKRVPYADFAENADKLNGYSSSTERVGDSIVRRLSNGDIQGRSYNLGMPSADPNGNTYPGQFIPYIDEEYWIRPASPANVKKYMGMENVENKSSATIRSELTKANVTTALGYIPIKGNSEEDWFEDYVEPDTNIEWVDYPTYYINDSGLCQLSFSVKSTTDRTAYGDYPFGLVSSNDDFSNMMIDSNALITIKVSRASDPAQWVVCAGLTEFSTVGNKLEIICCNPVYANDKIFVNVIWLK